MKTSDLQCGMVVRLKSQTGEWTISEVSIEYPENETIGVENDYKHIFTLKSDIESIVED